MCWAKHHQIHGKLLENLRVHHCRKFTFGPGSKTGKALSLIHFMIVPVSPYCSSLINPEMKICKFAYRAVSDEVAEQFLMRQLIL